MSNMRELTIDGIIDGIADAFADMAEQAFSDTDGGSDVVKLPLDCDGMTVHLGDLMAVTDNAFYVEEMHLIADADGGYYWQVSDNAGSLIKAKHLHHVGEDTLEGIMLEAVMRAHCDTLAGKDSTDITDLIERMQVLTGAADV